jgi:leucine efflux protein
MMFGVADYWAFVVAVIVFLAIPGVGNLAIITSTTKGRIAGGLAATLGVIARRGDAPVLNMQPRRFFQQAMLITLLNPKAIVFYMAFFPLFVDPARHQGVLTFGVMAATIAVLTFLYCVIVIAITHVAADRMRASPRMAVWLNRIAGTMLLGFGVKLAIGR